MVGCHFMPPLSALASYCSGQVLSILLLEGLCGLPDVVCYVGHVLLGIKLTPRKNYNMGQGIVSTRDIP